MTVADVRLRRIVRPREDPNHPDLPVLSVYRDHGVVPKDSRTDNYNKTPDDLSRYLRVRPDDLVVNKMKAWSGSVAVSAHDGLVSGDYLVCELLPGILPRYLHHVLRSSALVGQMRIRSKGIRPSQERLYWEDLAEIRLSLPELASQQRIAEFLDDQVARIDNIIAGREQQLALTDGMRLNLARDLIAQLDTGSGPPLSAVALIVDTEHKTAPEATGGGHWSAWTGAIRRGELARPLLREIDRSTYLEWTRRTVPVPGDVLLTREAPVGEVALLGPDDQNVAIGQRVVLARPTRLDSEYLRLVLMSPVFDRLVADTTQGSLHPHLNMGDIARMRVPEANMKEQANLGHAFTDALAQVRREANVLQVSIDRLTELKRSLITAAVTGEFDVSSADGSRVPA